MIKCLDDTGYSMTLNAIKQLLELRKISAMQLMKAKTKGCQLYIAHVKSLEETPPQCEDHPILQEFRDVFLDDFLELPPKREFDFFIDLVPRVEYGSKGIQTCFVTLFW